MNIIRKRIGRSPPKLSDSIIIGFEPPGSINTLAYVLISCVLLLARSLPQTPGSKPRVTHEGLIVDRVARGGSPPVIPVFPCHLYFHLVAA
jgi:hypothetical protein